MNLCVRINYEYNLNLILGLKLSNIALFPLFLSLLLSLGRDLICIQSMDGMLMMFEQESYAFGRFLPGFLLPGPLAYSSRTDSFITVSSCRQVESYKYVFMFCNYCIFWCYHLVCKQIKPNFYCHF